MEEWRVIQKFPNYSVSSMGKIRNNTTNKILTGTSFLGYRQVKLTNSNNKHWHQFVHVLVATTFIPNPENKRTVNHINKIRDDNRLVNLAWATMSEQQNHSIEFNKKNGIIIEKNNYRGIWKCNKNTNKKIKYYKTCKEASDDLNGKVSAKSIMESVRRNGTSGGFIWQYDDQYIKNDNDKEKWKLCLKYGRSRYYISNLGNLRNGDRKLKCTINGQGYKTILLLRKTTMIHRLVAKKFVKNPKPDEYTVVNHIDGNKSNNIYTNLEWTTHKLNTQHAVDNGLVIRIRKVIQYDDDNNIIDIFPTIKIAAEKLKMGQTRIRDYCNGNCVTSKYNLKFLAPTDDLINKKIDRATIIPNIIENIIPTIKIVQYDENNNIIEIFNSAIDAGKKINIHESTIHGYCKGYTTTNKYFIKYLSPKDDIVNKKIDPSSIPKRVIRPKGSNKETVKKVIQYDENNNIVEIFDSAIDTGKKLKLHPTSIRKYCTGHTITNKYMIKYLSPKDDLINKKINPSTIPLTMDQRKKLNKKIK